MAAPGVENKTIPMKKGIVKQVSSETVKNLAFFWLFHRAKLAEYKFRK